MRAKKTALKKTNNTEKPAPYYVVGDGVVVTRASEVVKSSAFKKQLSASKRLQIRIEGQNT